MLTGRMHIMRMRWLGFAVILLGMAVSVGGCGESRFDESKLYEGMDRSSIIAHFGMPDSRKKRDSIERLTYKDGEHYQYLMMLKDGKLAYWQHDRVYKTSRFSSIRN